MKKIIPLILITLAIGGCSGEPILHSVPITIDEKDHGSLVKIKYYDAENELFANSLYYSSYSDVYSDGRYFFGKGLRKTPLKASDGKAFYKFDKWIFTDENLNKSNWVPNDFISTKVLSSSASNNNQIYEIKAYPSYKAYYFDDILYHELGPSSDSYSVEVLQSEQYQYIELLENYNNLPVIGTNHKAFANQSLLESITLPNSIKSLGEMSFYNCKKLSTINLGNSLEKINRSCFENTTALRNIAFPSTLKDISPRAFMNSGINDVDLSNTNVTSISQDAFRDSNVSRVNIKKVQTVSDSAFRNCRQLVSVDISGKASVSIGNNAFRDSSIRTITFPKVSTVSLNDYAFDNCAQLRDVTLGNVFLRINSYAFRNCTSLTSLVLPSSMIIYDNAFYGCTKQLKLFYSGTEYPTSKLSDNWNQNFEGSLYLYSESEPTDFGYYWHYVNGVPTIW